MSVATWRNKISQFTFSSFSQSHQPQSGDQTSQHHQLVDLEKESMLRGRKLGSIFTSSTNSSHFTSNYSNNQTKTTFQTPPNFKMSDKYKPTEHGGLKEDGTPDKRVGTGQFAQGKVDPVEAGAKGGNSDGTTESTSNSGSGSGGGGGGEFAHGKVDPVEAGKKGGQAS
ncbi:hypothetical protein EYC80_009503 [Monilinia laxa]|uniref:Uncharacterized protein n=1 Tax=Monilinia laxa TaxID=61186 RepID=A0A5N6JY59_MONLA|nr:hypothetical protein EYC80_009503 [Monilinia laxa]